MAKEGFYCFEDNVLIYAPNRVLNKDFTLNKNEKDTYTYPVNNWYWFNSSDEANTFFNIEQNGK